MSEPESTVPHGYCRCGCGQKTKISTGTAKKYGYVKGQPRLWLKGHRKKTNKPQYAVDPATGCWVWQMCLDSRGYGRVFNPRGTRANSSMLAHRRYYEELKDEIPDGWQVDHLCRNRACVNPDHLEAVPPAENMRRAFNLSGWHVVRVRLYLLSHPVHDERAAHVGPPEGFAGDS